MSAPNDILEAAAQYKAAAKALVEATHKAFPVGTIVYPTLGGHGVIGRVTAAGGDWWHRPGEVCIENIKTGKERRFDGPTYAKHVKERGGNI